MPKLGLGLGLAKPIVVGGSTPVIPQDGLSMWLKADAGVTLSGSDVTAWADQSGNGRNALQYSGSFPTYSVIGGKSFVSFTAFVDLLVSNAVWGAGIPYIGTIFTVARFPLSSNGGNARLFSAEANTNYFVFGRGIESTNVFFVTNNQEEYLTSASALDNNRNYILGTTFDENNAAIYLNAINAGDSSVSSNSGAGNEFIGGGEEPSSIAEMVVYNRVLTTLERQQVEQYLNSKYQIFPFRIVISGAGTTSSNGEYVWDGVTISGGRPVYNSISLGQIFWFEPLSFWVLYDDIEGVDTYRSVNLTTWTVDSGSSPVPSSTFYYTP